MTTSPGIVLAKGINFSCARKYVEMSYGPDIWARALSSLSKESRAVWEGSLLVGSEYPFAAFKEMILSLTSVLKTKNEKEIAAIYEYIADQSLNTMYKIFFKLSNPSFVIKNYPLLWTRFFNAGLVEVPVAGKGHADIRFLLPQIFDDWLTPACLGYSKKAVELGGGRELTMTRKTCEKTADDLFESVYELHWKE